MDQERWQRTLELFHLVLEVDKEERGRLLADACGVDVELRQKVEGLLAGHENAPSILDRPEEFIPLATADSSLGRMLGPYRLEEVLGEGGMGVVYRASQEQPIRRAVALKLIRLGMATHEVVARFESERQTLAFLDHPNIAKVFDAGTSDQGRPYFVMELVEGTTITRFCDQRTLSIRQRLELFMQVCRAVHHAHQKGIIHRDLKPSNVLVTEHDGEPVPKVIDFGVARAIDRQHSGHTAVTGQGRFIGTPEYVSPEQAEMVQDLDIRTDVYSLGVLLYELLVGKLPFDPGHYPLGTPERWRRLYFEANTQPPSSLINADAASRSVADQRGTHPAKLHQDLRGDLDWIVMRALAKERQRRYGSASELAEELARHLRNEPVVAGPPALSYLLSKFVKRHRLGVLVAASAVILLVTFASFSFWQATQLRSALGKSEHDARKAEEVTAFLIGLFEISDPSEARGETISAREILDRGAERVASELDSQPEIQAAMMVTIGEIHLRLGLLDEADGLITGGLDLLQRSVDPAHRDIVVSHSRLSELRQWQDNLASAEDHARQALVLHRAGAGSGNAGEAHLLTRLGSVLHNAAKYDESELLLRQALKVWELIAGIEKVDPTRTMGELSLVLSRQGRYDEAEALLRQVIARSELDHGPDLDIATHKLNLASVLGELEQYTEAEMLLRESLELRRRLYGGEHVSVAVAMNNLARICQNLGKRQEAESLFREVVAMRRRLQGSEHSDVAVALANLGVLLRQNGQYEEAEALYREALKLNQQILGRDHPTVAVGHHNLSVLLRRSGQLEASETEIQNALAILRKTVGERHPQTARSKAAFGKILVLLNRFEEAEEVLRDALEVQVEVFSADHQQTHRTRLVLGECLTGSGGFAEAESLLLAAWAGYSASRGPDHEHTLEATTALAELYEAWDRPADAERYRAQLAASALAST